MLLRPAIRDRETSCPQLFAGLPQPPAQGSQKDHAKIRPVFENPQKIPAVQHQELAVGHCRCSCAALFAVEGRYLISPALMILKTTSLLSLDRELILMLPRNTARSRERRVEAAPSLINLGFKGSRANGGTVVIRNSPILRVYRGCERRTPASSNEFGLRRGKALDGGRLRNRCGTEPIR